MGIGKVFTVEMHHQRAEQAKPGDNVGLNIKVLDKQNMPRGGDVMVYKKDTTLGHTKRDQGWLLTNRLCAMRTSSLPYFRLEVEDGQRNRWQENGRSTLLEIQRDG